MSTSETAPNVPSAEAAKPPAPPARPSWETPRPAPAAPSPAPARRPAPASQLTPTYQPAPSYQPPMDEGVKYDLAGNPIPGSGAAASAMAPPAPFGYSAGPGVHPAGAGAGTWPPPVGHSGPGSAGYGAQAYRNNSGEQSHLPPELERLRWHWGAFFFPIFWTRKHGLTTIATVLAGGFLFLRVLRMVFAAINPSVVLMIWVLYGIAYFGLQMYGGLNGHKIGWRNRHFPGGVEEYFKVQSAWMWWGFGINFVAVPALYLLFFAALVGSLLTGHHAAPSSYGSPYGSRSYSQPYRNGGYNSSNGIRNSAEAGGSAGQ